jgi:hypothetical protein
LELDKFHEGKAINEVHSATFVTIFIDFNHRDIRSAEKVFRRKVLDIYATGIDYPTTAFPGALPEIS